MYKLPNSKTVYPEDIECIHDPVNGKGGIFLGNLEAAQNLQTLKKNGIRAVLTAAKGVFLNHPKSEVPFQLYIPGQDHERFDMSKYFNQSILFIKEALQKTNILVHCLAGVSRSVSLVIAYFIKYQSMSYESAYSKIKARRKIIHPNEGFITQLKKFQYQCRQNGPILQRSQIFQMRSSYSPSKRIDRRGYQGFYASPVKDQQLTNQRVFRETGYSEYDTRYAKFHPVELGQNQTLRNPQLYKSIAEDLRAERSYKNQTQLKHYSPDRYQKENRTIQNRTKQNRTIQILKLKRPSSNVVLQIKNEGGQSNQFYRNYQRYDTRNRIRSDYKPLDSIQNKEYGIDCEIDRKIAQIRKKYQEYTKKVEPKQENHERMRLEKKYANISTVQQGTENLNFDDFIDLKMRKSNTNYEPSPINDLYNGIAIGKSSYFNEVPANSNSSFVGSRLRRLQSYQI